MIKISILVMYCHIFSLRRFKIGAWVIGATTVVWSLVFILMCFLQCSPVNKAWDPFVAGTCLDLRALFIGNAIPNILTDVAILLMPITEVWKLQMRTPQRV